MDRIEVITSVERRRKHSLAEKERLAMAAAAPGANVVEIARAAGVDPSLVYRWRRALSAAPLISSELDTRDAPTFVPLTIAPPAPAPASESAPSMITIEFAGGARMKIEGAPDAKILASVIGALSKAER
ncbi:transposase [Methylosinus sp. PW1]|uniref:IS66-like element accessory protein TnpA n=1 Tax=Methylosinus sp. PW1 TaxID=107636 RepID=UPI0005600AC9|nr:transposase [Methylosinus sp. PW1]